MQKLTSLAFLFMVLTFFVGNTNAIEIQTENDDFHQKLKSFDEKIDKFLIEKPFPDAFFNVNMEKASVIQNKWGSGDFLEVEFSLEYNNETLHELDHFFSDYKEILAEEVAKRGKRCRTFISGVGYEIHCERIENLINKLREPRTLGSVLIVFDLKDTAGKVIEAEEITLVWSTHDDDSRSTDEVRGLSIDTVSNYQTSRFFDRATILKPGMKRSFKDSIRLSVKAQDVKTVDVFIGNKKKRELQRLAAEKKAIEEAQEEARRNGPEYKRSVVAEELCQQYEALSQTNKAINRQYEIDLTSGTTNLYEKRQLAAAKLYVEKEIERLKKEYKKLGGGEFSRKKQCE